MKPENNYYITTAIAYTSRKPHIGNSYEIVLTDAIARYQRLNGKMPFWLPPGTRCAHKTGEDDGITHDVGIVYAARPFAVCFLSQHTDPPRFIRAIQDITRLLYEQAEEGGSL